jgi:predicted acyl esterase
VSDDQKIFVPSEPLPPGRTGVLTRFEPGVQTLPAGFQIAPEFLPLPVDVVFEKDVAVTLRDGVTIRVDVFRPVGDEPVPVIVAWSPYGKGQGTSASVKGVFALVGLDDGIVSGLEKFEGPDPAYWCAQGYAVCNPDIRGVVDSEGDSVLWDRQEGRDCSDVIEWLAEQSWCSGKVGMSGTSYLAVSQWFTAAEQPPHLAAINPWEGVSDVYRDLVMRGGMPDTGFAEQLQDGSFFGKNRKEDILSEAGATAINLVEFTDPRTDTDNGPYHPMNHAGLTRLALLVDDVDEAFEAIASRDGVQIVCSPREIGIHQGQDTHRSRWFSFRDPFGVFITATQSDQPEAKDDQDG